VAQHLSVHPAAKIARCAISDTEDRHRMPSKSQKTPQIPGRKVPRGRYSAVVPFPLPAALDWSPRLLRLLSDADRLIGKLAGEGGRLPNPHVLMRPFVRREAVLSGKIEGTQATLGELLAANIPSSPPKAVSKSSVSLSPRPSAPSNAWRAFISCNRRERQNATASIARRRSSTFWTSPRS